MDGQFVDIDAVRRDVRARCGGVGFPFRASLLPSQWQTPLYEPCDATLP